MSSAFKLNRARRLLLRAVALVSGEDEEGSSGSSGDTDTPRGDASVGASRNGPPMSDSNSRADQFRRNNRAHSESQSSPPLSHHSRVDTSQPAFQQQSLGTHGRGRESFSAGHAALQARNKEGQRLFGFNPNNSRKRRKGEADGTVPKRKKPMWSRDCICLNSHYQDWIPTVQEKISLSSHGLGLKRITFQQDGDGQHIQEMITNAFPKLNSEFNLLRAGSGQSCKQLLVIGPPSGMTVPYLKDIVGQAKLYIRPNKDIEGVYDPDDVSEEDLAEVNN